MENSRQDVGRWVDERLASLNAMGDWQPNAARALALLRRRDRTQRVRRAGSVGAIAAAKLGFYEAAVQHLFRTQPVWEKDGSIDAQMAKLLPPAGMQKVRQLVETDKSLDETVAADVAMAVKDKINQTPSMIVVANGK